MVKLTAAQEKFCLEVVSGKTNADAFRIAYPNSLKWKGNTLHQRAFEMSRKSEIQVRIEELRQQAQERAEVTLENLTEDLRRVMGAAEAAGDHSAAVAAIRQISKMHGLDTEKRANDRSPLDGLTTKARAELRATIETALEKARRDARDEVA